MPSSRTRIRMSPEEIDTFLADQLKVQVATVGKRHEPHLSTLFYALRDGHIAFWTYRASQKVVNLRRDPTMTCLVEGGEQYDELRGVALYGTGRIIEDLDEVLRVGGRVGARMTGRPASELDPDADPAVRAGLAQTGRKRVVVVMEPTRTVSWDHRKLANG